jgi:folate-binding protein YgfZ
VQTIFDPPTFGVADLSDRGKLRLTGPQRAWYLHQVSSQAFEDIEPGESRVATMLTHTGRMVGLFEAVATDDAILCHFEPSLVPELPEALRRYVFATRVEIEDVTDSMGLVLVLGADARLEEITVPVVRHEAYLVGIPAVYLWVDRGLTTDLQLHLKDAGAVDMSADDLETVRVAHGVPRWGNEIDTKTFPQEVGIDKVAVHYDKGCYTGQEAMAKIHFRGKVNRKLTRLVADAAFERGQDVVSNGDRVGTVTSGSVGQSTGQYVGLALVKSTVPDGTRASVAEHDVVIEEVG